MGKGQWRAVPSGCRSRHQKSFMAEHRGAFAVVASACLACSGVCGDQSYHFGEVCQEPGRKGSTELLILLTPPLLWFCIFIMFFMKNFLITIRELCSNY